MGIVPSCAKIGIYFIPSKFWNSKFKEIKFFLLSTPCRESKFLSLVIQNLGFYYPPTDTFYGILTEMRPVKVKTLPRDRRRSDFVGWQCDCDPHDEDKLIATFDDISEVWDGLKIDGKDFEEVINHSYIVALN